eukprot:g38385.t1
MQTHWASVEMLLHLEQVELESRPPSPGVGGSYAVHFFLEQRPELSPPTTTLLRLTRLIVTLNKFSFNSLHFIQVRGVAMGIRMGPSYACLFV